jgi:hypothetical protein
LLESSVELAPAAAVLLTLYLNHRWFGGAFRAQQTFPMANPLRGAVGLLLHPGHGLILTTPIVLLAAIAWPRFLRTHPEARLLAVAFALQYGLIALFHTWHGGFCYGPRYLVPFIPLLLVPLVAWGPDGGEARRWPAWTRPLALGVVIASLSINLPPAFVFTSLCHRHTYVALYERIGHGVT